MTHRHTPRARVIVCGGRADPTNPTDPTDPATRATVPGIALPREPSREVRHCDDYIHDLSMPVCLRVWLLVQRLPAVDGELLGRAGFSPRLYADHRGRRVRVMMASRYGDLGVAADLEREVGYDERGVAVAELSGFGVEP